MPILLSHILKKNPKYVEGKQKYWQFCMFILLKSATSGDNKHGISHQVLTQIK